MVIRNERWACKHELPFRKSSANNLLNVNFEEIWFEFEYYEGLFDATQVQLAAILEQEDDFWTVLYNL